VTPAEQLLQQLTGTVEDALGMVEKHNATLTPASERYLLVDVRLDKLRFAAHRAKAYLRSPAEQPVAPVQPEPMLARSLVLWCKRRWPLQPQFVGAFPNRKAFIQWVGTAWAKPLEYVTVHDARDGKEAYRYHNVPDLLAAPLQFLEQPAEGRPTWSTSVNANAR
jgi:hypothetical protein